MWERGAQLRKTMRRQNGGQEARKRGARARAAYEAARRDGTAGSFWSELRGDPARVLLALFGILLALALVALPVVLIGR